MKTISSYLLISLALLGAVACTNSEFKKTKSGLLYKIYSDGKGEPAKKGQFLKANIIQKLRDSTLYSTYGGFPFYTPVDSPRPTYSHNEILSYLRKGDSAVCVLLVDSLERKFGGQLPPFLKKKDKITITLKVLDIFPSQDLVITDRTQELAKEKDREVKVMEKYLADSNVKAEKTEKGTYVVVKSTGDGTQVDSGKQVFVRYTGKLFPSGKVFESNMTGPGNDPFKFVVGAHQIIPGWDDGLRKFKKGGKGTLYVPAFMAYDQQPGPGHKPFESLIFDIEVVDVTDAPPPSAQQPRMPMQMPTRPGQMPVRPGQPQARPH
jgi:FKBP-type peptidyl-prolyl cis-trans isomerase FkpA